MNESTAVGSLVYTISDVTDRDIDEADNSLTYTISKDLEEFDGTPYFVMKTGTSPDIMLQKVVDYDAIVASGKIPTFLIRVTVQDHGGRRDDALFNFTIINEDDLPPAFIIPNCDSGCTPSYTTIVPDGFRGALTNVTPAALKAVDQDKQHAVQYSLVRDSAGYHSAFRIDPNTGIITALSPVLSTVALIVKVTEISALQRFALANMLVKRTLHQGVSLTWEVSGEGDRRQYDDNRHRCCHRGCHYNWRPGFGASDILQKTKREDGKTWRRQFQSVHVSRCPSKREGTQQ